MESVLSIHYETAFNDYITADDVTLLFVCLEDLQLRVHFGVVNSFDVSILFAL